MPWAGEPARIKKKAPSTMSKMNQSAKEGWNKTKRALDPTRMFKAKDDPSSSTQPMSNMSDRPSVMGGLFGPKPEPHEVRTVNDFLSQPTLK